MTIEWLLPDDLTAARAAREEVTAELRRLGLHEELVDDVALVASELAANAIRHGAPPVVLRLSVIEDAVRVEVRDQGRDTDPAVREAADDAGSGRGLAMIDALARVHGWQRDEDGMSVWAELPLRGSPSP